MNYLRNRLTGWHKGCLVLLWLIWSALCGGLGAKYEHKRQLKARDTYVRQQGQFLREYLKGK